MDSMAFTTTSSLCARSQGSHVSACGTLCVSYSKHCQCLAFSIPGFMGGGKPRHKTRGTAALLGDIQYYATYPGQVPSSGNGKGCHMNDKRYVPHALTLTTDLEMWRTRPLELLAP